jgi:transcriptional regulator with XRE-family HTH domain
MNKPTPNYDEWIKEAEQHDEYHTEGAILEFTEDLIRVMKRKGLTRTQLANKLGKKPAYITKMLGGENNFTLATMVKVARALDMELKVGLEEPPVVRTRAVITAPWTVLSRECMVREPSIDYSPMPLSMGTPARCTPLYRASLSN